jgi:6-pyruvoyltetrahydropterin/6-carboxytetrahydropterin synthase
MDFGEIKRHVRDVMATLDHKFLNETAHFDEKTPPSSENIAVYVADALASKIENPAIRVTSVTAWESENASATFRPVH